MSRERRKSERRLSRGSQLQWSTCQIIESTELKLMSSIGSGAYGKVSRGRTLHVQAQDAGTSCRYLCCACPRCQPDIVSSACCLCIISSYVLYDVCRVAAAVRFGVALYCMTFALWLLLLPAGVAG